MNTFFISTTSTIQNATSIQYLDVVYTNVVIGTNLFSDFAASFTDFFGGKSKTYQSKLTLIYNNALSDIRKKAFAMGANAIIGFRIDFDEISGKDKSMLMVNLSGTACIVDIDQDSCSSSETPEIISQDALDKELYKHKIISQIHNGVALNETMTEFLFENPIIDIIDNLINRYIANSKVTKDFECQFIENYFSILPKEIVCDKVYTVYPQNSDSIIYLIKNAHLFSARHILSIVHNFPASLSIPLLQSPSSSYTKEDVETMYQIIEAFKHLPDTGRIETVKSGIFGKEQSMFICQNGHKNELNEQFCTNYYCGVNIKGLTKSDIQEIQSFSEKTEILSKMFL